MKQKFFFVLGLLVAFAVQVWADSPVYTLTAVKNASNSTYASTYDVTVNGMTWNVPGNQNFDGYWRIGGSSLTNASRVMYSKTAMQAAAKSLVINHKGVSRTSVIVNSVKLTVASDIAFSNTIDEVITSSVVQNAQTGVSGELVFVPSSGVAEWPSGSYYKITFVITNTNGSNGGLDFTSAVWSDDAIDVPEEDTYEDYDQVYSLVATQNSANSSFTSTYKVVEDDMTWAVSGNQNYSNYWRFGGSTVTNAIRTIKGKSAMNGAVKRVTVKHNGVSINTVTINSATLTVASDANYSQIIEEVTLNNPVNNAYANVPDSIIFMPSEENTAWPTGSYYKLTLDITTKSSNAGLNVLSLNFYGDPGPTPEPEPELNNIYTLNASKNTSNATFTTNYTVTVDNLRWSIPGSQNYDGYWLFGGGNVTDAEVSLFTKQAMRRGSSKRVVIEHNGVSYATVSSAKLTVASDADFTEVIDEVTITNPLVSDYTNEKEPIEFTPSTGISEWPLGSFYKITFVVSTTSAFAGLKFVSANWYGTFSPYPNDMLPESTITAKQLQSLTPASDVLSIYSDIYPTATPDANFNDTWYNPPTLQEERIGGGEDANLVLHYSALAPSPATLYWTLGTALDLSQMNYLSLDLHMATTYSFNIVLLSDGMELTRTKTPINGVSSMWRNVALSLTNDFNAADLSRVTEIQFISAYTGNIAFTLDNVYFSRVQPIYETPVEASRIYFDKSNLQLLQGEKDTLFVHFDPENTFDKTISWTITNGSGVAYKYYNGYYMPYNNSGTNTTQVYVTSSVASKQYARIIAQYETGTSSYYVNNNTMIITATSANGKTATDTINISRFQDNITLRLHPDNVPTGTIQAYARTWNDTKKASEWTLNTATTDANGWYVVSGLKFEGVYDVQWVNGSLNYSNKITSIKGDACFQYDGTTWSNGISKIKCLESFTARFENWNGALVQESNWLEGTTPVLQRPNPTRAGDSEHVNYVFIGWEPALGPITENTTYVAQFGHEHTVTFVDWDESIIGTPQIVYYGQNASSPADPIRDGYRFTGWDITYDSVVTDLTVHAQYVKTYTVNFLDYNGEVLDTQVVDLNGAAVQPADPIREGYRFSGWDTDFNMVTEDIDVHAQYIRTYIVTFVNTDGTELSAQTVDSLAAATAPADPTSEEGIFAGWDKDFSHVTEDMTVTARYDAYMREIIVNLSETETDGVVYLPEGNTIRIASDKYIKRLVFTTNTWPDASCNTGSLAYDAAKKQYIWTGCAHIVLITVNTGSFPYTRLVANVTDLNCDGELEIVPPVQSPITVRLDPQTCATWSTVRLWAWTGTNTNLFDAWPGIVIDQDAEGWYSYTFDESVSNVNIIWTDGTNQTSDLKNITESTCFALNGQIGTTISARIIEGCGTSEWVRVKFMDYDNITPLSIQIIRKGENAIAPENPTREGYTFAYWDKDFTDVQSYLTVKAIYSANILPDTVVHALPALNGFYDFLGKGKKGAVVSVYGTTRVNGTSRINHYLSATADYTTGFQPIQPVSDGLPQVGYIDDVNGDGQMDFGGWSIQSTFCGTTFHNFVSFLSLPDNNYSEMDRIVYVPNCDLNNDGRMDYLRAVENPCDSRACGKESKSIYACDWYVNYQQADGSYREEQMNFVSQSVNNMITIPQAGSLNCGALYDADNKWDLPVSPTKVADVNNDGLLDMIDENKGCIWYQTAQGNWSPVYTFVQSEIGDFNNDQLMDVVYMNNNAIYTSISQANGSYSNTLLCNQKADNDMYLLDFNKDGHVDILATLSSNNNTTGYAYSFLFLNNGNGTFTAQPEQNYGTDRLLFKACQDIDGDGYYDLLAFELDGEKNTTGKIYCLKGNSNSTFAAPQELYSTGQTNKDYRNSSINVADLDGDGKQEVWVSRRNMGYNSTEPTTIHSVNGIANTTPTAPAAPQLSITNGILHVQWGNGADSQTSDADLTYALRIGTTPGGNDILNGHALVDGTRRNFMEGNMGHQHKYALDLSSYAPATMYVAVQAIDAQHAGSAWSEESSIVNNNISAKFTLSANDICINQSVTALFTALPDSYTHEWVVEDGQTIPVNNGTIEISFFASGNKSVTHIIKQEGMELARAQQSVNVLPNGLDNTIDVEYVMNTSIYADYNFDGYLDLVYENMLKNGSDNYQFANAAGTWNIDIKNGIWVDYTHNGAMDYIYANNNRYYALIHDDADGISLKQENDYFCYYRGDAYYSNEKISNPRVDITHDGYYDFVNHSPEDGSFRLVYRLADGSYSEKAVNTTAQTEVIKHVLCGEEETYPFRADMDHDGFIDFAAVQSNAADQLGHLAVLFNRGAGALEEANIPFVQSIDYTNYNYAQLVDINADGYLDIFAVQSDGAPYILWNNANMSYAAPQRLPMGDLESYRSNSQYLLEDINNDGILDVICTQSNPHNKLSANADGLYVWYMGATAAVQQGFLRVFINDYTRYGDKFILFRQRDHLDFYNPVDHLDYSQGWEQHIGAIYPIIGATNEAPAVPTNIRTQQTSEGLLIEWDAAIDDHTPAAMLRYNLSVKKAGKTGEGAYLISPLNRENDQASVMPHEAYDYISATRFFIPMSALEARNYEISLQAIDLWDATSAFSSPITVNVSRSPIEAPQLTCVSTETMITYAAEPTEATPIWDFDGAYRVVGTGYGPYKVKWNTSGEKTITLTVNNETFTQTITVDAVDYYQQLPSVLFKGQTATFSFPEELTPIWYVKIGEKWYNIMGSAFNEETGRPLGISASDEGKTIRVSNQTMSEGTVLTLQLTLRNTNGCEITFEQMVTITSGDIPTISLVTVDANAHNVINFNADAENYPNVRILKEGNVLNQFEEIAVVTATQGTYTDLNSNAEQQPDRYKVQGVLPNGSYSVESATHKTVHATISKGVNEGTYNLIWNAYEGAEIVTYNILRGSSKTALTQIASVAASATSYTDNAPLDAQPYYAVEYVLSSAAAAPAHGQRNAPAAALTGRSNVVNRNNSGTTPVDPTYYTIRFLNWDGAVLQQLQVLAGSLPAYVGATPTRPADEQFTYTFAGWTPTIVDAVADADYTASYTAMPKSEGVDEVQSGNECTKVLKGNILYILRGGKVYTITGQVVE